MVRFPFLGTKQALTALYARYYIATKGNNGCFEIKLQQGNTRAEAYCQNAIALKHFAQFQSLPTSPVL